MNEQISKIVSRLLDQSVTPGEGTLWSLDHRWSWPLWFTIFAAVLIVVWVSYFYFRESSHAGRITRIFLICLRSSLFVIVAVMISQIILSLRRTGLPTLVIAVDTSLSMGIADNYEDKKIAAAVKNVVQPSAGAQPTRLDLVKGILTGTGGLAELEKRYSIRIYEISDRAVELTGQGSKIIPLVNSLSPKGHSTRLGDCLRSIMTDLRGGSSAAVVVFSDGITSQGESLSEVAIQDRGSGIPIFTVALGSEQPLRDIELADLTVDDIVFADDLVNFQFTLKSSGLEGKTVQLALHEQGKPAVLAEMKVQLTKERNQRAVLSYRPTEVGDHEYVVEAKPRPEELNKENNVQSRMVAVRKEKIRVLLVQAYPSYEFRYLRNMLGRDSSVQLNTVLQEADAGFSQTDETALPVFPVRREELFAFDVIIFGDVNPAFLSAGSLESLGEFVEKKGGGLIVIAGQLHTPSAYRQTPLATLLPVSIPDDAGVAAADETGFIVSPTDLGLATPQMQLGNSVEQSRRIWQSLPDLRWLAPFAKLKPAARVLADQSTQLTADGRKLPVFCAQYVGAGQVLLHATDETWRWRFRVGDVYFARYWIQAIRSLSRFKLLGGDRTVDLTSDRREYQAGDPVHLRVRFLDETQAPAADAGMAVIMEQAGSPQQRVQLSRSAAARGIFEATLPVLGVGKYHAWIAPPAGHQKARGLDFRVVAPAGEFERTATNVEELSRTAQETGGRFYRLATVADLPEQLPRGQQVPIEALPPYVLWNRWWLLACFLLLLTSEWVLRKRKGML